MIQEIIFFNNVQLYNQCEIEARRQKIKTNYFIAECVKKTLEKNGIKNDYKKAIDLWFDCEALAKQKGCKIADVIELSCQFELTPAEHKESFWDKLRLPAGR